MKSLVALAVFLFTAVQFSWAGSRKVEKVIDDVVRGICKKQVACMKKEFPKYRQTTKTCIQRSKKKFMRDIGGKSFTLTKTEYQLAQKCKNFFVKNSCEKTMRPDIGEHPCEKFTNTLKKRKK
ncbi:MAG: hypothetical protein D6767_02505 [Candidatus Hydrogenedentota bacterium]|nr:MAG: hypothetical protein D6767_02505 [Candidatus Hydrogenedentota bacterium]